MFSKMSRYAVGSRSEYCRTINKGYSLSRLIFMWTVEFELQLPDMSDTHLVALIRNKS